VQKHPEVRGMAPFVMGQALLVQGSETKGAVVRGLLPSEEVKVAEFANHMRSGSLDNLKPGEFNIVWAAICRVRWVCFPATRWR
jgi:lipoprotein-releasing system permease protein